MVSPAEETQMELQAFQAELQRNAGQISDNRLEPVPVIHVAERITDAAMRTRYPETAKRFQCQAVILKDNTPNATCRPGGKIIVCTGILPIAKYENGLAAILGHEASPALIHHGAERMSQTTLTQLDTPGANPAMEAKGINPNTQQQVMQALAVGARYGILLYSRELKSEADCIGLLLAAHAGYKPEEAVRIWQRTEQTGGQQPPEFLSTPGARNPSPPSKAMEARSQGLLSGGSARELRPQMLKFADSHKLARRRVITAHSAEPCRHSKNAEQRCASAAGSRVYRHPFGSRCHKKPFIGHPPLAGW